MFWVPICFLLFLIWGGSSLIKGIANFKLPDPDALNPDEERIKFLSAVKDYDDRVANEVKATMKYSDIWDFLGRTPSEEEKKIVDSFSFLYKEYLIRNALMSQRGKLEALFIFGQQYPTKDPAHRAFIDEVYLKIEDTLEARGIHNVVTVERVGTTTRNDYSLRDVTRGGHHSLYGDNFSFANYHSYANPGTNMYYLKNKPAYTERNGGDQYDRG